MLLLAAFSAYAFAEEVPGAKRPGFYRRVITDRMVQGRIVALRSDHDRALNRALPRGDLGERGRARAAPRGTVSPTCGRSWPAARWARPARLGAGAAEMELIAAQTTGLPSGVVTVDGSRVVTRDEWLIGAHRDIYHGEIATLVLLAAGLLTGGPEGLRRPALTHSVADEEDPHVRHARSRTACSPAPAREGHQALGPEAEWLVLAYLAADNDLEGELLSDLAEMERVGSTPGVVEVLAQVDRSPGNDASQGQLARHPPLLRHARRRIRGRSTRACSPTSARPTPATPACWRASSRFGAARYPARKTALVLLNHGSGFYVPPEMQSGQRARRGRRRRIAPTRQRRRPIFHTTRERLLDAAPANSRHRLRRRRGRLPRQPGAEARAGHGAPPARPQGRPGRHGRLPHDDDRGGVPAPRPRRGPRGLGGGRARPGLAPRGDPRRPHQEPDDDARRSSAPRSSSATSSPTATPGETRHAVGDRPGPARRPGDGGGSSSPASCSAGIKTASVAAALLGARRRTLQFYDGLYVDLHHLAENLAAATGLGRVTDACRDLQRLIDGQDGHGPVIAQGHVGAGMAPARGLSIYFPPFRDPSAHYRDLDFARRTRWADFLDAYLRDGRERPRRRQRSRGLTRGGRRGPRVACRRAGCCRVGSARTRRPGPVPSAHGPARAPSRGPRGPPAVGARRRDDRRGGPLHADAGRPPAAPERSARRARCGTSSSSRTTGPSRGVPMRRDDEFVRCKLFPPVERRPGPHDPLLPARGNAARASTSRRRRERRWPIRPCRS